MNFLKNKLSPGPITKPTCLAAIKKEKADVRDFLVEVRAISPNITAPALTPAPTTTMSGIKEWMNGWFDG